MGKKKKKEKKKKVEESPEELENAEGYSLDAALHSTKSTETTLQSLMKEVTEGEGFTKIKKEDEKIRPHLSHESRSEIAQAYALEDVPLAQRQTTQKREKKLAFPETKEKVQASTKRKTEVSIKKPSKEAKTKRPPKIQVEISTVPSLTEEKAVKAKKEQPPTPPKKETPVARKDNIYLKLTEFFEELLEGYNDRYERWENSISNILAILRKMRKITKKNTDDLVVSINNQYSKIQSQLELFKTKRDQVEKVAEVDIESMSGEFKRVLGMLELQIKEYQLKRESDDLIHELKNLS
ncbi:MAG: hypothetical protein ACXAEX_05765 [Promethearchaeota archaeon]|jgi:hypothetical protein